MAEFWKNNVGLAKTGVILILALFLPQSSGLVQECLESWNKEGADGSPRSFCSDRCQTCVMAFGPAPYYRPERYFQGCSNEEGYPIERCKGQGGKCYKWKWKDTEYWCCACGSNNCNDKYTPRQYDSSFPAPAPEPPPPPPPATPPPTPPAPPGNPNPNPGPGNNCSCTCPASGPGSSSSYTFDFKSHSLKILSVLLITCCRF